MAIADFAARPYSINVNSLNFRAMPIGSETANSIFKTANATATNALKKALTGFIRVSSECVSSNSVSEKIFSSNENILSDSTEDEWQSKSEESVSKTNSPLFPDFIDTMFDAINAIPVTITGVIMTIAFMHFLGLNGAFAQELENITMNNYSNECDRSFSDENSTCGKWYNRGFNTGQRDGYESGVFDCNNSDVSSSYLRGLSFGKSDCNVAHKRGQRDYKDYDAGAIIINVALASSLAFSLLYIFCDKFCRKSINRCINNVRKRINNIRHSNVEEGRTEADNDPIATSTPLIKKGLGPIAGERDPTLRIDSSVGISGDDEDFDFDTEGKNQTYVCFEVPKGIKSSTGEDSLISGMRFVLPTNELEKLARGEDSVYGVRYVLRDCEIENSGRAIRKSGPSNVRINASENLESITEEDLEIGIERDSAIGGR